MVRSPIDPVGGHATPPVDRRSVLAAILLAAAWLAVSLAGFALTAAWLPGREPQTRALVVLGVLTLALLVLLWATQAWRRVGLVTDGRGNGWRLLLLPLLLVLLPLAGGVQIPSAGTLTFLLVGYVLTGFSEETFFRGVVLGRLRATGPTRAVVLAAVLFGAVHLGNVMVRPSVSLVVAQAVGAFCFAIAYGALRLRIESIWPLIVLHGLHDLLLRVGGLPVVPTDVLQDVVLLVYGIALLRRGARMGDRVPATSP